MKKLLISTYSVIDKDEPEDSTVETKVIGMYDNEKDLITATNNTFEDYVNQRLEDTFYDDDEAPIDPEDLEEFKDSFSVAVYEQRGEDPMMEAVTVGELYETGEGCDVSLVLSIVTVEK